VLVPLGIRLIRRRYIPRGGLPRPPRTQFMPVPGGLGRPPGGQEGEV